MPGMAMGATFGVADNSFRVSRGDNEDEFEYEYEESRTEDYYFTLDLTTHDSEAAAKHKIPDQKLHGPNQTGPASTDPALEQPAAPVDSAASRTPAGQLQILDLHSDNPVVKLGDSLYSCDWSTGLGTQVYIARPGVSQQPKHAGHAVDVVGLSRARLIGRPATLQKRENVPATNLQDAAARINKLRDLGSGGAVAASSSATASNRQIARFAAAREETNDPAVKAQASFLERLSEVKRRKGEVDLIPFLGVKQYRPPPNQDEIRRIATAELGTSVSNMPKGKAPLRKDRGQVRKKRKTSTDAANVEASKLSSQTASASPGITPGPSDTIPTTTSGANGEVVH